MGKFGITRSCKIPASPGRKLEEGEVDELEGSWPFRKVGGGLMWLSNLSRAIRMFLEQYPDISKHLNECTGMWRYKYSSVLGVQLGLELNFREVKVCNDMCS